MAFYFYSGRGRNVENGKLVLHEKCKGKAHVWMLFLGGEQRRRMVSGSIVDEIKRQNVCMLQGIFVILQRSEE